MWHLGFVQVLRWIPVHSALSSVIPLTIQAQEKGIGWGEEVSVADFLSFLDAVISPQSGSINSDECDFTREEISETEDKMMFSRQYCLHC